MTSQTLKRDSLEKLLRYVLGVAPDEFGLYPDALGFVPLKSVVAALHDEDGWRSVREGLILMLANQPGGRSPFELAEGLIRLKPALASLPPEAPPASALPKFLYGAFKPTAWALFSQGGLRPKAGEDVVRLWSEAEMALKVGRRISSTAVLVTVLAVKARQAEAVFIPYSERLWLTTGVPAAYLNGPPLPPLENAPAERRERLSAVLGPSPPAEPEIHRGKKKGKRDDAPDWKNQLRRERRRGRGE